jgi:hypothetical protein
MSTSSNDSPPRQLFAITDSAGRSEMKVRTTLGEAKRVATSMDANPGSGAIRIFGPYTLDGLVVLPGSLPPDGHVVTDDSGRQWLLDRFSTQKQIEGYAPGVERAADWIIEQAVSAFRGGKDEDATSLRKLAESLRSELVPKLRREAAERAKDYPAFLGFLGGEEPQGR